jgi:two-component system chemotaxis sensor kinase CheA
VRGSVYPVLSLAGLFGLEDRARGVEVPVAVIDADGRCYGLAVDRFVSEVEVLVKPLAGGLENCREFQGAAILGDGRVVLVLNPAECAARSEGACK